MSATEATAQISSLGMSNSSHASYMVIGKRNRYHNSIIPKSEAEEALPLSPENRPEIISVDSDSGIPLWFQLRNKLVYLIASGKYKPGDKLPTVRELAVDLGINYNTVSKVYQDIERDGYIVSKRGKGTFVAERKEEDSKADLSEVDALADEFIRQCIELGVPVEEISALIMRRIEKREN